jgi:hypothetical protein
MTRPIRLTTMLLALALAVALPAGASAETAKFRASLSGTYTQQGTTTNDRCYQPDPSGDGGKTVSMTASSAETDSFKSVKPITLTVSRVIRQKTVDAGSFQQLATKFTLHRESGLNGTSTPKGCDPSYDQFADAPDCGTKTKTYKIRVYGRVDKPAFSFGFSNGYNTIHPDDPFTACFLAGGGLWPGYVLSGAAPVKPARLFNRRVRTIVVHGLNSGTTHEEEGTTGTGTFRLSWTLTLKRL